MYSKKVLELYRNPKNLGKMENPDGVGNSKNPVCGDSTVVYIRVDKDEKGREIIKDTSFETMGCATATAAGSTVTELAKGKTLDGAMGIKEKDIADSLDGLPTAKMHCCNLAVSSLRVAIEEYRNKTGRLSEGFRESITRVYPCDTDPNKVIVEVDLANGCSGDYFNAERMFELFKENPELEDVKCSTKLGLAKFRISKKEVNVFKNGKIIVREADDEADAIKTIVKVKEILSDVAIWHHEDACTC
jgi:nitrogen fixation NifU-like protein